MDLKHARWIGTGRKNDKHNTLPPELLRKKFDLETLPARAVLQSSAMGVYEASVNGQRVDDCYFAPGYTHYESYVQLQTYDVSTLLKVGENRLDITVANGWWLGSIGNKNNRYGDCRGLIAVLTLTFSDGAERRIVTDESWLTTKDTPERFSDFYNGETIDLRNIEEKNWYWESAQFLSGRLPALKPHFGAYVREDCRLTPVLRNGSIYDFGQNHAGVIQLTVKAKRGTTITVRHGEILDEQGRLFTKNLRKAKQTLTLFCGTDGENTFAPRFTFMGFRYAEITADSEFEIVKLESAVLTSDCKPIGTFSCSDEKLNRLFQNIQWGQRSNFIDIPTDCPQRDERMGWTGDIAVFAETAACNRDIGDFMRKWLYDLSLYQRPNGTLPVTIPENKTYQPTPFKVPIAIWGDAATMVPWAVYRAYGDKEALAAQYDSMKAYTDAEIRAAARTGRGKRKFLWDKNPFQYGDWCAPGENFLQWRKKGKYLSTCFLANSVDIMRQAAKALKKMEDEQYYSWMFANIQDAFASFCILPNGHLAGDFQSNYVCALYFGLIPKGKRALAARRLTELVRENQYKIATGFAGTPYLLFALADNGYIEEAYKVLQNEACPGWLYTVKAGGTTMWERWDALAEDGSIKAGTIPDMVSFNHYAYGAVGAFFYRRILGIEIVEPGYRSFRVRPVPGGSLTHAEGHIGDIFAAWKIESDIFNLNVTVPAGKEAEIVLPSGAAYTVQNGTHYYKEEYR